MSLVILLKAAPAAVASIGAPASLPHLSLLLEAAAATYSLTAEQGTYTLAGQDAGGGLSSNTPAPLPSLALLGGLGGAAAVLTAEAGAYAITGQDAGGARSQSMAAEYGTYTTSGQVAAMIASPGSGGYAAPLPHVGLLLAPSSGAYVLVCDPGLYSVLGSDGMSDFELTAEQGSYTFDGQDADLRRDLLLECEASAYETTGQDATFSISSPDRLMPADTATYDLTGYDAELTVQRYMGAGQGFFALQGNGVEFSLGLLTHYAITAEYGTYAASGQDAAFEVSEKVLDCEYGDYSIRGYSIPDPPGQSRLGAGRSRKPRRKYTVEIDGEVFDVDSREEAAYLLEQAKKQAEEIARIAVERAAKAEKRPTRKVLSDARKTLQEPEILASEDLAAEAEAVKAAIDAMYKDAMVKVEIAARLRREEDDDEAALLLLIQ
jgi:hypothetical protein